MQRTRMDRRASAACEQGFTLVELLIVVAILGILASVSVPAYVGMRDRASDTTAKANLRSARAAAEHFAHDNTGTKGDADGKKGTSGYRGMTGDILRATYAPGLAATVEVVAGKTKVDVYCLKDTQGGRTWSVSGPGSAAYVNNAKCK